ncbi:MAG: SDR family NAD(P)-dependent oxidoreductase [Bryobacteraceae bacterium]
MESPGDKLVALVTGSTGGLGKGIALALAREGFAVALHSRGSAELGLTLARELPGASYTQADLTQDGEARRLVGEVLRRHGRLDALVNNAGITVVAPHRQLAEATPEIWRSLYEINVIAPWSLIRESEAALRRSAEDRSEPAAIVNISSHAGVRPKGASIPYAVSKAALNHMTRLLALALAPSIRVNAVAPGLVDTTRMSEWEEARTLWNSRSPMRRPAMPEDVAEIVLLLIRSRYLTGEVILADGGLNLT